MSTGWVKVHRRLAKSDVWVGEVFSRGQAWVDLIMLAQYYDATITRNGRHVKIKRGEVAWSERRLSMRWRWSRGKLRRWYDELREEGRIHPVKRSGVVFQKIDNFERYQAKNGDKILSPEIVPRKNLATPRDYMEYLHTLWGDGTRNGTITKKLKK